MLLCQSNMAAATTSVVRSLSKGISSTNTLSSLMFPGALKSRIENSESAGTGAHRVGMGVSRTRSAPVPIRGSANRERVPQMS